MSPSQNARPPHPAAAPPPAPTRGEGTHRTASPADPWPGDLWKRRLRSRLVAWFDGAKRDLPWRRTRDPYRVWISEVMLQQTQVATVVPYFERFMAAFPNVAALAAAAEQDVLRLWEGLGYYRRARQLHRAAQICVDQHAGEFPSVPKAIRGLPGVGRYTAGAILSIAFDEPAPIVEANTLRVYCRLLGFRGDPHGAAGQAVLWKAAEAILPRRGAGTLNQALMELGAIVCTPAAPPCGACPVAGLCAANKDGLQKIIPPPKPQPKITALREAAVIVRRGGRVLLVRREDGGRWAGLWDFPRFAVEAATAKKIAAELQDKVRELTGVEIVLGRQLTTLKHGVTRFQITLTCYEAQCVDAARRKIRGNTTLIRWLRLAELDDYPLNVTGRKLTKLVAERRVVKGQDAKRQAGRRREN